MAEAPTVTTTQAAEIVGVDASTFRRWRQRGLIKPTSATVSGYTYDRAAVERLADAEKRKRAARNTPAPEQPTQ